LAIVLPYSALLAGETQPRYVGCMKQLSAAEQLLYTTVKISTFLGKAATGSGTGFFYASVVDGKRATLLITNKHVLEASNVAVVACHLDREGARGVAECTIDFDQTQVYKHPDADVDLCALNFTQIQMSAQSAGTPLRMVKLTKEQIPTDEEWGNLDAIEEVTMIGCPNGIYDEVNNFAIVRRGVTSSNPALRYNGKPEFLVDMACFPGSSGSPIFLFNPNGYMDRLKNMYMMATVRLKLLGVLYAGPQISTTGQVILAHPSQFQVLSMMHLGNAIRSTEVLRVEEEFWRVVGV
jgi:Trypsin-like peptidase domain